MIPSKISVCIATYNGEKYIKQQLNSILCQLEDRDEVIISDDSSTDNTIQIIESFKDKRIRIFREQKFKSPIYNFENAISKATGDIIFLSDQDDIWHKTKVHKIKQCFLNGKITCIVTNASIIDGEGKEKGYLFFKKKQSFWLIKNIVKNNFIGCTMAFVNNKEIPILPFPKGLPMHDWFIGLRHILKGKVKFINDPLIYYRRHSQNITKEKSSSIINIIKWRFNIIISLLFFKK
jgi:glycosyltransferase, family 2